jgi:hypothetical protein
MSPAEQCLHMWVTISQSLLLEHQTECLPLSELRCSLISRGHPSSVYWHSKGTIRSVNPKIDTLSLQVDREAREEKQKRERHLQPSEEGGKRPVIQRPDTLVCVER